jgi:hypothetical protein
VFAVDLGRQTEIGAGGVETIVIGVVAARGRVGDGRDARCLLTRDAQAVADGATAAANMRAGLLLAIGANAHAGTQLQRLAGLSRVKIWITPPTASGPYSAEAAPRRISMRSMRSNGRLSIAAPPEVAVPTRVDDHRQHRSPGWRHGRQSTLTVVPASSVGVTGNHQQMCPRRLPRHA